MVFVVLHHLLTVRRDVLFWNRDNPLNDCMASWMIQEDIWLYAYHAKEMVLL